MGGSGEGVTNDEKRVDDSWDFMIAGTGLDFLLGGSRTISRLGMCCEGREALIWRKSPTGMSSREASKQSVYYDVVYALDDVFLPPPHTHTHS